MPIQLHMILLVSTLSITSLYAPPHYSYIQNSASGKSCKNVAKRHIAGASGAIKVRSKEKSARPASGSLDKKKARIALKKYQLRLEEMI
jgi:hypothetical protein